MRTPQALALAVVAVTLTVTGCTDPAMPDGPTIVSVSRDADTTATIYSDGLVVTTNNTTQDRTSYHPSVGLIYDDMPEFDCTRMGNLVCGPDAATPAPLGPVR